ncbi:MAG TPA: sulfite exporter TauE/SafE family protein [Bacteroidales bacterium]|jgi:hypothetical protein|nr:sulfite exporter TauE/SafE family protein [Bacteroidales bacterium]MDI9574009.1 sulfite exporter TauE/SafE family protein [Bacteroidota bacterium]OQC59763.1 MAG: Sulfite exporter TauE/SafE [Bacteroidetes bacterium ADurb.Bin012]MBP9512332.1 sulfite exporter TauE/SafE family protein [Bacteroidales bacterium]MBP9588967.1 sulfite exporter TauE/SafE family protein [Bacteroidales bacterium]
MEKKTSSISLKTLFYLYLFIFGGLAIIGSIVIVLMVYLFKTMNFADILSFAQNAYHSGLLLFVLFGFFAQMIDGTLGMAYGVSSTSFLISTGISPAIASASVHAAEIFTTGISGISHWRFKNLDKKLFIQLAIPGVIGSALGAYVLSSFQGDILKPIINVYLLLMGFRILYSALRKKIMARKFKQYTVLGLLGGFVDASGGGGWGPVVTTTLVGTGETPRVTIGTVNTAEFLVTLASTGVFTMVIGLSHWHIIVGLILGGMIAAPLAAFLCNKINARWAMVLVGILIMALSIRTLLQIIF